MPISPPKKAQTGLSAQTKDDYHYTRLPTSAEMLPSLNLSIYAMSSEGDISPDEQGRLKLARDIEVATFYNARQIYPKPRMSASWTITANPKS